MKQNYGKTFFFLIIISFTSCVGARYLESGEKLLLRNKIKGNSSINADELEDLIVQEPNRKILKLPLSPYVAFYEIGSKNYDKAALEAELDSISIAYDQRIDSLRTVDELKKARKLEKKRRKETEKLDKLIREGTLFMRWGEPLAVYDTASTRSSVYQMELFLQSKGFLEAEVNSQETYKGLEKRRVIVKYIIQEKTPYIIDSLILNTGTDSVINSIIKEQEEVSLLRIGDRYDQEKLQAERERIEDLLKNNGYYAFNRQFIEFNVYQSADTNLLAVETIINKPANRSYHKQYRLNEVNFTTDVNTEISGVGRQKEVFNEISYQYYKSSYRKKILDQRVFLRPDELYSINKTINTQRQLANLDMFRFVNIKFDTAGGDFVANIFTSPLEKYSVSNEIGVNVNVTFGLPGPFYNLALKNRNPFGGMEILELSGRIGFDAVANLADQTQVTTATDGRINLSLSFPHFLLPLGNDLKKRFGALNPRTKIGLGYNYTERPEYLRNNVNGNYGYSWFNKGRWQYDLTVLDVNLIESRLEDVFIEALNRQSRFGNQLRRSFEPSFVSSTFLSVTKNFNDYGNDQSRASFLKFYIENGGNFLNFDRLANELVQPDLAYFQFAKASVDYRHYSPFGKQSTVAFRVRVGVARPYGNYSENILPYEKYFFAGGSNSIRAWAPRRLGPGSYADRTESGEVDYSFEQPGEIILEASVEARRNLINYIDGAIFMDAGNVWLFSDVGKEGSEFEANRFYKEIAVGTGLGIRVDFSFLILRFDVAWKLYDPALPEGSRLAIDRWNLGGRDNYGPALNIGIGYPF